MFEFIVGILQTVSKQYQYRPDTAENAVFTGFYGLLQSFPFHRGGGFGGDVVNDAVDGADLVCDAAGCGFEDVVRDSCPVGCHKVVRRYGAERDGVSVRACVAHDADALRVREHGEILARSDAGGFKLFSEYRVRLAQRIRFFLCYLSDYPDREPGPGERLAFYEILGYPELQTHGAHLVLEQIAQRLDYLLKIHHGRQSADVVVAFYR